MCSTSDGQSVCGGTEAEKRCGHIPDAGVVDYQR